MRRKASVNSLPERPEASVKLAWERARTGQLALPTQFAALDAGLAAAAAWL